MSGSHDNFLTHHHSSAMNHRTISTIEFLTIEDFGLRHSMGEPTYRDRIIQELLTTEVTFNVALQQFEALATTPLKAEIAAKRLVFDSPDIPRLFDLIGQIFMVSSTLKEELSVFNVPGQSIVSCLRNFPTLIIIYFDYIRTYHTVSPALARARQTNLQFAKLLTPIEGKLGSRIENFLITPIQRPPRYRMLFQDLLKHTPTDSPEYEPLRDAVDRINTQVAKLDQGIAEFEEATAMAELETRFVSFPVFVSRRRLFFHGDATKFSRKKTQPRYLVVFSDKLVVAEVTITSSLKVNKLYESNEYLITDVVDRAPFINAVDIREKTKSCRVNMKSPAEKQAILEGFSRLLELTGVTRLQLEQKGFAPVWIPDDQVQNCMECSAKFSFVHRRHHCRSCGDCICKDCFRHKIAIPGLGRAPQGVCTKCYTRIKEMPPVTAPEPEPQPEAGTE
jgi:hypothetical protein